MDPERGAEIAAGADAPPADLATTIDPVSWVVAPPRAQTALHELWNSFVQLNGHYLDHAEQLDRFDRHGWAGAFGFDDVLALARSLFGFRREKTRALLKIYRIFVLIYGVDRKLLAPIAWSRLALVADVVTRETVAYWLGRARILSLALLRAEVRRARQGELTNLPRVAKSFAIPADAEGVVELALEAAGTLGSTDDRGVQLTLLAAEFIATHGDGTRHEAPLSVTVRFVPEEYGKVVRILDEVGCLMGANERSRQLLFLCEWFASASPGSGEATRSEQELANVTSERNT